MVTLRPREDGDLEGCVSLLRTVHERDRYPLRFPEDPSSFFVVPDALGAWVALLDGRLAGHVLLRPSVNPRVMAMASAAAGIPEERLAVVGRLLVAPWARRRGVGRRLLGRAAEESWGLGRHPVLDVVAESGAGAIALYEREGWSRAGSLRVTFSTGETVDELVYVGPVGPARPRFAP